MPSPVHPYSDYGVALRTLKSARSWLSFLMFACVAAQFIGFALMWWTTQPYEGLKPKYASAAATRPGWQWSTLGEILTSATETRPAAATTPAAQPLFPQTADSQQLNIHKQWNSTYTMLVPLTQIAALIAVLSQSIIVFVTLLVVLVAQAPGVAQITRSLIWSVLLVFMFFPWQYLARDFPVPGVIFSYGELLRYLRPLVAGPLPGERVYPYQIWLLYGRFIVWPLVGLLVLLITSERYRAGVMIAIGHPLQSILQPRGAMSPAPPGPGGGGGGKPMPPVPVTGKKYV